MHNAIKVVNSLKWLPNYSIHLLKSASWPHQQRHLILALADHFEPCYTGIPQTYHSVSEQVRRMRDWAKSYPAVVDRWRDVDGHPFKHTYFYLAEHYHPEVVEILAEHCRQGWGEVEIHLHHGIDTPDSPENTRNILETFRTQLLEHGCLSKMDGDATPRYAFVHGNWALANSGNGRFCGVDEEMQILADTGCYADFTLPSAPEPMQIAKVNSIYECGLPMNERAPHRKGRDLRVGEAPRLWPVMIQGPLMLDFGRRRRGVIPGIENSELSASNPPTLHRLKSWRRAAISILGRPEWCFIKLHCHGMIAQDQPSLLGQPMAEFLRELTELSRNNGSFQLHFVTAREMVNIVLAACDGLEGDPGGFRDYRLKLITPARRLAQAAPSQFEYSQPERKSSS